jgi:hypothetical protein
MFAAGQVSHREIVSPDAAAIFRASPQEGRDSTRTNAHSHRDLLLQWRQMHLALRRLGLRPGGMILRNRSRSEGYRDSRL